MEYKTMEDSTLYKRIYQFIENTRVISTHEHHLNDEDHQNITLEGIIDNSYVGWQNIPVGTTSQEHAQFLEKARYNSYFVWLQKAIDKLYSVGGKITPENWEDISNKIKRKHKDPNTHIAILKKQCRYMRALSDIYWQTGSNLGHPDLFSPVVRTDMFVKCFHPLVRDHDDNSPWEFLPAKGLNFGEYMNLILSFHRDKVEKGAVSFKLATAYERPLVVGSVSYERAARIYMTDPNNISSEDVLAYGDYIINRICELAAELDVPYQIHTGLGELRGSNPMLFEPTIIRHPETRFVLFHGGSPWYHEIGALAHNHSNVLIDMVWLPIISTQAAVHALDEYIEVIPSADRIAWGSDTWTSEEALGALLAFQHTLAQVLAKKINEEYIDIHDAQLFVEKILFRNAKAIYKLELSDNNGCLNG
jgi:predicted TIM-barrel fold metal-dependent hydrolase